MERSSLLMSAKIHFIEGQLSIVHVPLVRYEHYLPLILQLLFPSAAGDAGLGGPLHSIGVRSWANKHAFLNVSVTPIDCSIVCETGLAKALFGREVDQGTQIPGTDESDRAFISMENFVAVSVEGAGMEAGQRVLELTTPLALAGISLFFITTYYSDYILVPAKAKGHVVRALESRGFAFEESSETYVNPHLSTASSMGSGSPTVPPATTLTELQDRTSALLSRHNIRPMVDPNTRLIQCGGRNSNPETFVSDELALQHGITKSLIYRPGFFSLTLTQKESSGLLLEKRLMANFDVDGSENVLLGANEDYLIPIALNLQSLPIEASGIVCGVAGRLVDGPLRAIEMAYLSTAKAGIVMVEEQDLEHAMEALKLGANREIHE